MSLPAPLFAPARLRPVALRVTFAIGLVFAMFAMRMLAVLEPGPWVGATLATTGMITWMGVLVLRKPIVTRDTAHGRITFLGALLGVATAPVAYFTGFVVFGGAPSALLALPIVMLLGAPIGLIAGTFFGLVAAMPLSAVAFAMRNPSPQSADRATALLGAWALLIPALIVVLTPDPPSFYGWKANPAYMTMQYVGAAALGGLGLFLLLAALRRLRWRQQFIERVVAGHEPGWALLEAPEGRPRPVGLECIDSRSKERSVLLCRCDELGQGAYRRADALQPVAWVPPGWVDTASLG
ncbi:MAG: hypothetical protein AAF799_22510 [Myxococcota bacterium]